MKNLVDYLEALMGVNSEDEFDSQNSQEICCFLFSKYFVIISRFNCKLSD